MPSRGARGQARFHRPGRGEALRSRRRAVCFAYQVVDGRSSAHVSLRHEHDQPEVGLDEGPRAGAKVRDTGRVGIQGGSGKVNAGHRWHDAGARRAAVKMSCGAACTRVPVPSCMRNPAAPRAPWRAHRSHVRAVDQRPYQERTLRVFDSDRSRPQNPGGDAPRSGGLSRDDSDVASIATRVRAAIDHFEDATDRVEDSLCSSSTTLALDGTRSGEPAPGGKLLPRECEDGRGSTSTRTKGRRRESSLRRRCWARSRSW